MTQPQTRLVEAFNFLETKEGMINKEDLRFFRWLKDAETLIKSPDFLDGYILRGIVYCGFGYLEEAKYALQNAYKFSKLDSGFNYATALRRNGDHDEAEEVLIDLLSLRPNNSQVFSYLSQNIVFSLNIEMLDKAIELFVPSGAKDEKLIEEMKYLKNNMILTLNKFAHVGTNIFVYRHVTKLANHLLNTYYHGSTKVDFKVLDTEIGKFLQITQFLNNVDIDSCLELNQELEEIISSDNKYEFSEYQKIIYRFLPSDLYYPTEAEELTN